MYISRITRAVSLFIITVSFFLPSVGHAQTSEEKIRSFEVTINVYPDSTIMVDEKIVYDFGQEERHGIYREIPLTNGPGTIGKLQLRGITVVDENGTPYAFEVTDGGSLRIKVGDADTLITGVHTYLITYTAERALGYFEDYDELYWNVTGNEWTVPIESASATVTLPQVLSKDQLMIATYCGAYGENTPCGNSNVEVIGEGMTAVLSSQNGPFATGEGMTMAVGFPKGIVTMPVLSFWEKPMPYYVLGGIIGLLFLVRFFVWLFGTFFPEYNRRKRPIIAEYEPPKDLTPSQAGQIYHLAPQQGKLITADILYLASEGYLIIEDGGEEIRSKSKRAKAMGFIRTGKQGILPSHLLELYNLVSSTDKTTIKDIQDKKQYKEFQQYAASVKKSVEDPSNKEKFSPALRMVFGIFLGVFVIFAGVSTVLASKMFPTAALLVPFVLGFCILLFGIIKNALRITLSRMTKRWYAIAGLREYIKVAEKDRIKFESNPEDSLRVFSTLLPYAVIFGLEKKWMGLFASIIPTPPTWYHGSNAAFIASMNSFPATVTQTSYAGSPSGAGGGGSSGGGGGGGGGGSW